MISKGLKIKFKALSPHCFLHANQPKISQGQLDLQNALNHLLSQEVVGLVPPQDRFKGFYSNLFTVSKHSRGIRPILDLKSPRQILSNFKMSQGSCKVTNCLCRHPKCLFTFSHLFTSSAFSVLLCGRQLLSVCHTTLWPILRSPSNHNSCTELRASRSQTGIQRSSSICSTTLDPPSARTPNRSAVR